MTNTGSMHYLLSTYRVGMLALETLARKVHDDRPQVKYARNPSYGEDVKWLLGVAKKLGESWRAFLNYPEQLKAKRSRASWNVKGE